MSYNLWNGLVEMCPEVAENPRQEPVLIQMKIKYYEASTQGRLTFDWDSSVKIAKFYKLNKSIVKEGKVFSLKHIQKYLKVKQINLGTHSIISSNCSLSRTHKLWK